MEKQLFELLLKVVPNLEELKESAKLKSGGYQDLCLDKWHMGGDYFGLAMAHYFKSAGDLISDPDMAMTVNFVTKEVVPYSFQNQIHYSHYDMNDTSPANLAVRLELNKFLKLWLENLIAQGHKIAKQDGIKVERPA